MEQKTLTAVKYTIANLKTWQGNEGEAFQCSLIKDGKKIGTVTDDGWGGCYQYRMSQVEEEAFSAFAKSQPSIPLFGDMAEFAGDSIEMDSDILMDELVSQYQQDKQFKRLCKTKTVFFKDGNEDVYYTVGVTFSPSVKEALIKKHPDSTLDFVNERYEK